MDYIKEFMSGKMGIKATDMHQRKDVIEYLKSKRFTGMLFSDLLVVVCTNSYWKIINTVSSRWISTGNLTLVSFSDFKENTKEL